MGTMGEDGTPNTDIPEGFFEVEFHGRKDRLPFPRQAGSWYHWTKVFDSGDVMFGPQDLRPEATDVMQGVIYGIRTPEMATDDRLLTRFDFDETWGTALNRFVVQAVLGLRSRPYGKGEPEPGVPRPRGLDAVAPSRASRTPAGRASTACSTSSTPRIPSTTSPRPSGPDRDAESASTPRHRASRRPPGRGGAALLQPDP